ncbi:MAG: class I adenylate-forming enzyme family protein [Actinomycetota bacterium]
MPVDALGDAVVKRLTAAGQLLELAEEDVDGVRMRVWKNAPPSLRAVFELSKAHGEADFIVYEDERWTFDRHYSAVASLSSWLVREAGVAKGDRVAIAMRNYPEWSVAFWAAACAGAIVVPLNAWWTGDELAYGLRDSGTKVLFCDIERWERIASHGDALPLERAVVVRSEAPERTLALERLLSAGEELPEVALEPVDDATIFYTSGTTGEPKGALGTHRNICTNLFNLVYAAQSRSAQAKPEPSDRLLDLRPTQLLSVPFFHVTGCHSTLVPTLAFGSKLVLMHRWNAERALELIEREKITSFGGVPTMVWQVLESPDFDRRDTSSVQSIGYGGAPAPPELVRRIREHFPTVSPGNGYGMTETSSLAVGNGGEDYLRKPESVGRPSPINDIMVADESGAEVPTGDLGEVLMRGPNVVKGYWNKPDATAATFHDGWLHSGDIGRIDEEGFLYIVDRAKDMVIRGGENVYCVEIETVLYEHPAVSEAAVIGIPHRVLGEEVAAVVKRVPGSDVSEDQLKEHVGNRLAAFKVPVRIWISDDELPRNPAGKVLKRELREKLLDPSRS